MTFTIEDLGLAYRKAKVDLYYSSNPSLLAIADYENKLFERLKSLLAQINGDDEKWVEAPAFLGPGDKLLHPLPIEAQVLAKANGLAPEGDINRAGVGISLRIIEHQPMARPEGT